MKKTKTEKHILDKMVENYLTGKTQKESVKEFGYEYTVLSRELKRRGIPVRALREYVSPSKEEKDIMVNHYLKGKTSSESANLLYQDSTIYLDRKYNMYLELLNDKNFIGEII